MAERTFKTSDTGKEYPARFSGLEFRYNEPDAVAGDVEATLDNLRAVCSTEDDFAALLTSKFNGQGYNLDWQKELKSFLGATETVEGSDQPLSVHRDKSPEEVYEEAVAHMAEWRVAAPTRRAGTGKAGKVAKAEARAEKAENMAATLYRAMSEKQRKQVRGMTSDTDTLALFDRIDEEEAA